MTTSQNNAFLHEILGNGPIPAGKLAYFRERFRDSLYEIVVSEFLKAEKLGLTKAEVARRIGRKPEQITRWLGAPGNWTVETVSDLLLAISRAEPIMSLSKLNGMQSRIGQNDDWWVDKERAQTNSTQQISPRNPLERPEPGDRHGLGVKETCYEIA